MRVDLHIHTTASDSRWTPAQVIAGAQDIGIGLFAVTDHDTVGSVILAEKLARAANLAFLRGVEVSTNVDNILLHILGYGIDPAYDPFLDILAENRAKLEATNDDEIQQLIAQEVPLDFDDYRDYRHDRSRGGWKALNYLIDHGQCTDITDYFETIRPRLTITLPNYLHPSEAVAMIRQAGGVPILAHPGASFRRHGGMTEATLTPLLDYGIVGMECYSQYHDETATAFCVDWCEQHNWLITGGSDYHGGFVNRQLGVPVVDTSQLRLGEIEGHIIRS